MAPPSVCGQKNNGAVSDVEIRRACTIYTCNERRFMKEIICSCKQNYYRVYFIYAEFTVEMLTKDIEPKLLRVELEGAIENDEWAYQ